MQVFNAFLKIMRKHWIAIAIYIGLYAVILSMISSTYGDSLDSNFEMTSVDISVIDRDHSDASKGLTEYLGSMHRLIEIEDDETVIQDYIYYRYVNYVLMIPEGFEEKLLAGETEELVWNVQAPDSTKGIFLNNQVESYLKNLQIYLAGGYSLAEAMKESEEFYAEAEGVEIAYFSEDAQAKNEGIFYFFQYLPYIYILVMVCGLAPLLLTLNKREIYERTLCSSLTLMQRNLQIALASALYSAMIYVIFMVLGFFIFGKAMLVPQLGYLLINSVMFLLFAVALTIFISMLVKEDQAALNLVANIIGLGMCFLCGAFVPQSLLSKGVLAAARFLPAFWYIKNNNILAGFSEEAFTVDGFWTAVGIQALFAVVLFAGALVAARLRQQKG